MAERISHDVTPPKIGPDAHEELERLLQTLHEHGVLRLANDVVGANTSIASVVVDGLGKASTLNAIQNLAILGMMLSEIPPERFYRVTFAVKEALDRVGQHRPVQEGGDAPGISGAYRMLNDDELWRAVAPLADGLKAFAERLDKPVDKPVSDYFGKPTSGP
ncbi:DUF1641 domain-containing protein [Billgrantia desiderata]|uniref:DUF1641 domain-containing protein n=1 Tax=Billgrantia desiderata TaxID=52021 RepID=A0AAW4YRB2_9GAMM|nr:DUF1641 domain-containing protein [Halomonas desiderata]MCE8014083.1 DUF1641 domain-containing protein [Halomonas desiderata]MCE8030788.1 DUF1641 domain-containing protein [Halomonas desiderata]MCE8044857.1 DUF1641 domain-containing protein [Halomonas desiderata]MCE8049431.1 DUF1641 domain-containing protein [Halomonas desiderata]MCE8051444.1 DUF1641 domain-containing protein [Halomonas desiderata]